MFREVAEAYTVLSDEHRKARFDAEQSTPGGAHQNEDWDGVRRSSFSESFHSSVDAEDMFRRIFGDFADEFGKKAKAWTDFPEADFGYAPTQEVHCAVSFKEAARGCDKQVEVLVQEDCPKCNGNRYLAFLRYYCIFYVCFFCVDPVVDRCTSTQFLFSDRYDWV
jgi:DnaJ-class molecular chaperone